MDEIRVKLGNLIYELNVEPEDVDAIVDKIFELFEELGRLA